MTWNISVWDSSQGFDQYYVLRQDTSPQTLPLFTKRTLEVAVRFFFSTPKPRISVPGLTFSGCVSKMDVSQTKLI